mgnify:CR=1 FL=1
MAGENIMSLDDIFAFKRRFRRREDDKGLNSVREVYYRRDYAPEVTAFVTPPPGAASPEAGAFRLTALGVSVSLTNPYYTGKSG